MFGEWERRCVMNGKRVQIELNAINYVRGNWDMHGWEVRWGGGGNRHEKWDERQNLHGWSYGQREVWSSLSKMWGEWEMRSEVKRSQICVVIGNEMWWERRGVRYVVNRKWDVLWVQLSCRVNVKRDLVCKREVRCGMNRKWEVGRWVRCEISGKLKCGEWEFRRVVNRKWDVWWMGSEMCGEWEVGGGVREPEAK
jgi:hypothetical protein